MILAIAALVLQFPAIPQRSLPATAFLGLDASATSQPAVALTAAGDATPAVSAVVPEVARTSDSDPGPQPADAVAFQPGRLAPEPVVGVTPAAIKAVTFSSSPEAAAFIASTPTARRAEREDRRRRRIWLGLSIAQSGAATFDAWSTRRVVSSGGQELNPMLRPFAGNASLYVAIQAAPLLLDYVGHRMMTSQNGWARHTWWMPQAIGTALSIASGAVDLSAH
jgi:hypothetical protein